MADDLSAAVAWPWQAATLEILITSPRSTWLLWREFKPTLLMPNVHSDWLPDNTGDFIASQMKEMKRQRHKAWQTRRGWINEKKVYGEGETEWRKKCIKKNGKRKQECMDENVRPMMAVLTMWDLWTIYDSRNQDRGWSCQRLVEPECKHMHTFYEKRENLVVALVIFKRSGLGRCLL